MHLYILYMVLMYISLVLPTIDDYYILVSMDLARPGRWCHLPGWVNVCTGNYGQDNEGAKPRVALTVVVVVTSQQKNERGSSAFLRREDNTASPSLVTVAKQQNASLLILNLVHSLFS